MLELLLHTGSIYGASGIWEDGFHILQGSAIRAAFSYEFKTQVIISKVIYMTYVNHPYFRFATGNSTFTASNSIGNPFKDYGDIRMPKYAEIEITDQA